jgi:hypothetical protein
MWETFPNYSLTNSHVVSLWEMGQTGNLSPLLKDFEMPALQTNFPDSIAVSPVSNLSFVLIILALLCKVYLNLVGEAIISFPHTILNHNSIFETGHSGMFIRKDDGNE